MRFSDARILWYALVDKYRSKGATGLFVDAGELAVGAGVVGIYSLALAGAAIGGLLVAAPLALAECVGEMAEFGER